MSYVDNNLLKGETVVQRAHMSPPAAYIPPVACLVAAIIAGVILMSSGTEEGTRSFGIVVMAFGAIVATVAAVGGAMSLAAADFALTNRRIIAKTGLISSNSLELNLTKVEGVGVDQGVLGKVFGYGTVVVTGTGGQRTSFPKIAKPTDFRSAILAQIDDG